MRGPPRDRVGARPGLWRLRQFWHPLLRFSRPFFQQFWVAWWLGFVVNAESEEQREPAPPELEQSAERHRPRARLLLALRLQVPRRSTIKSSGPGVNSRYVLRLAS